MKLGYPVNKYIFTNQGWMGLFLLLIFCVTAGYSGTRLGACWDILEERFPEHRGRTRNPYSMIAYRAVGQRCRYCIKMKK